METITVYVQILEKEVTSLSGSVDLVKEHEKLLLNQNFSKALIVGYCTSAIYQFPFAWLFCYWMDRINRWIC
ncbi:MAG: hypothetical protein ACXAAT_19655, partial [Candidatus Hodarchaeales archaeon]